MKRVFVILFLLALCVSLSACKSVGKTDNIDIDYGNSIKFSEAEIKSAVDAVLTRFTYFNGCDLKKVWYDEGTSDSYVEGYISNGHGSVNGVKQKNVIVLFSDFYVGSSGGDDGLNPDSTYTGWMWVLIRENKDDKWKVDDWGY